MTNARIWFSAGATLALLLCATAAHAAKGGVGVTSSEAAPNEATTTTSTPLFHPTKPSTIFLRANRDIEFLWSDTYVSAFGKPLNAGAPGATDLDLFGKTIAEDYANPFGFPMTDIQLVYDYLNFPDASRNSTYSTTDTIGFMVSVSGTERPRDRAHIDTYLYVPAFSHNPGDDFYEPNPGYPAGCWDTQYSTFYCKNYGSWTSSFLSDSEDVSTNHSTTDVRHFNSQQIPGPMPSQVGDTASATRWSRADGLQSGMWNHEFQHNLNRGAPTSVYTEIFSSAAEALGGESGGKIRYDVPYTWSLLESNYQAWREFTAYLAYNFRGTDLTYAGRSDDLLWRWAHGAQHNFAGLASRLDNAECTECTAKAWLSAYSTGADRLPALIHNWRVANYVNNSSLAEGQYGYPAQFGFVPSRDVGNWQDMDGIQNNAVAIPPEVTLGKWVVSRDTTLFGTRCSPTNPANCVPIALRPMGSEYWIIKTDATLRDVNRPFVARFTPLGSFSSNCLNFGTTYRGRLMVSLVAYQAPVESLAVANCFWRHPDWAKSVVGPVSIDVDSIRGSAEVTLPTFGVTHNAVLLVASLGETNGADAVSSDPVLPYSLNLGIRNAPYPVLDPTAIQAVSDSTDRSPSWSPSNTEVVYVHQFSGTSGALYRQNINGTGRTRLFTTPSPIIIYLCDWSPRGDWVVYDRSPGLNQPFDVWAYKLSTGEQRQLTTHSEDDVYPSFSTNGQKVAYWYNHNLTWEIHAVNLDGTGDVLVTTPGFPPGESPRWSASGDSLILFNPNSLSVYSVPVAGGSVLSRPEFGTVASVDVSRGNGRPVVVQSGNAIVCGIPASWQNQSKMSLRSIAAATNDIRLLRSDREFQMPRYSYDGTKVAWTSSRLVGGDRDVYYGGLTYNHAPVMTAGSYADNPNLVTCSMFQRTLSATDSDGDAVTWQLINKPGGMTIAGGNILKWLPNASQVGEYYVTLRAKDANGGVDQKVVYFMVSDFPEMCSCPNYPYCYPAGARPATEPSDLPVAFGLSQNQPNPFHEPTTIRFALPTSSHVRLEIFDLLGRRVRTLVDSDLPAAFHSRQWDLRTDHGDLVRPGIYMYRMIAGEFRDQKKMLLVP